jgi:hypothetical protein
MVQYSLLKNSFLFSDWNAQGETQIPKQPERLQGKKLYAVDLYNSLNVKNGTVAIQQQFHFRFYCQFCVAGEANSGFSV